MGDITPFIWAGGIEDTFIEDPHRATAKRLEEYELIAHYAKWRDDFARAASLGISALRWGIPWYRVERQRGRFDWSWVDDAIDALVGEHHLEPIVDLIHYGTPSWLPEALLDREFVSAFADYTQAFAERYAGRVRYVTPFNEPYTAAEFCGRRGDWPPYRRGDGGFAAVMIASSRAAAEASRILHGAGFTTVHVEVATGALSSEPALDEIANHITLQNELYWDLLTGRVDERHPLYAWLCANGAGPAELARFREHSTVIDLFGVNYYPQWSYQVVCRTSSGDVKALPVQGGPALFERHLRRHWDKYHLPMMVTETSVRGPVWEKSAWLDESIAVVARLRREGIAINGYTWFPIIEMIDWEYRNRPGAPDDFRVDLGLWSIERTERSCVDHYREVIARGMEPMGAAADPARAAPYSGGGAGPIAWHR